VSYAPQSLRTRWPRRKSGDRGFSLLETVFALAILLTSVAGLFAPFLIAISQNEMQGNVATRVTELSQDKMEGLIALQFTDPGLGGAMGASSTVGSVPPAAPVANYVDYLDKTGAATVAAAAVYTRQWSITTDAPNPPTLKTITVVVTARNSIASGLPPSTKVVCYKSDGL
jgi:type II secretory pathway pseudopilin PulG